MERKVLIEVLRPRCSDYATLVIRLADRDRTPLLRVCVAANELKENLVPEHDGTCRTLVDGELVAR
jgi:hypothetical protein